MRPEQWILKRVKKHKMRNKSSWTYCNNLLSSSLDIPFNRHGFGSWGSTKLKDGALFLDEEIPKLGYPIGKYFAIKTVEKPEMSFIKVALLFLLQLVYLIPNLFQLHENLESIESMCISKNRKTLAVSEKIMGEKYPQVSIYVIKNSMQREKERTFRYTETKAEVFEILLQS